MNDNTFLRRFKPAENLLQEIIDDKKATKEEILDLLERGLEEE